MSKVELTTLGKSCEFFNGKAHEKDIAENGKYIVVNSKFISSEGKSFKRTNEQMFPLYKGDIVMVMSDVPNGKALAKCFIIDKDNAYSLNQRICCIRSKEFDTKYLYYQLNRHEHFLAFNNGENQTNLRKDDILACPLIKPSMEEQRRMVAELDLAVSNMVKAILNTERNYLNSKELFESYMQGLFEKKGDGWKETTLDQLFDVKHGFAFLGEYFSSNGEYVLLTPGNFFEEGGYRERGEKQKHYIGNIPTDFILKKGDLLVAMTEQAAGLLGSPIIVPESNKFLHNQRLGLIIPKPNIEIDNKFFFYVFNLKKVRKTLHDSGTGVKVRHTSPTKIGQVEISYPKSLAEQQAIVYQLDTLRTETQKLEAVYQKKIDSLEELKSGIIKRAFENELIEAE